MDTDPDSHRPGDVEGVAAIAMRLSGDRFNNKGIPADSLTEVAALEDILRSLVIQYWKDRHPKRQRAPKGYAAEITLRLSQVGEGSAVPLLELPAPDATKTLFGPPDLRKDFMRALTVVQDFIAYYASRDSSYPDDIRRLPLSKLKRFGQSLLKNESIQVASGGSVTEADAWKSFPRYTSETRSRALLDIGERYTQPTKVKGQVTDIDFKSGTLTIKNREAKGSLTVSYLDSGAFLQVDSNPSEFEGDVTGIGEFDASGQLLRIIEVDTLDIVDLSADAKRARARVRELEALEEGWLDGEMGSAITAKAIQKANEVIQIVSDLGGSMSTIYPTQEGGVKFFWPESTGKLSVDVEVDGGLYLHSVDLVNGTFREAAFGFEDDLVSRLEPWVKETQDDE